MFSQASKNKKPCLQHLEFVVNQAFHKLGGISTVCTFIKDTYPEWAYEQEQKHQILRIADVERVGPPLEGGVQPGTEGAQPITAGVQPITFSNAYSQVPPSRTPTRLPEYVRWLRRKDLRNATPPCFAHHQVCRCLPR